jgi:hypothetical protein
LNDAIIKDGLWDAYNNIHMVGINPIKQGNTSFDNDFRETVLKTLLPTTISLEKIKMNTLLNLTSVLPKLGKLVLLNKKLPLLP